MFLNDTLSSLLHHTKAKSDAAYSGIVHFLDSFPAKEYARNSVQDTVVLETSGYYLDEFGYWHLSLKLDKTGKVESLSARFKGEKTSRKPYSHTTTLSLVSPSPNFPQSLRENIVDFRRTRTYNYRYAEPEKTYLTVADIKKIEEPISISKFSMSLGKNRKSGKLELVSSENYGNLTESYETETIKANELALEA